MPTVKTELEIQLYSALKRITQFAPPEYLRRHAEKKYGLSGDEAVEMAYENVLGVALRGIEGVRPARAARGRQG